MSKTLAIAFAVGIVVIALAVGGVFYMQRGAHVGLTGTNPKIRSAALDENSSIVVADFHISNPSYVLFVVRSVKVILEDRDGKEVEGQTVSELDAKRLFEGPPILGQKFNDTLVTREKVSAGANADRMVAARFELPLARIEARKRILIRIEDADGRAVSELSESGAPAAKPFPGGPMPNRRRRG
jgi:hypothetical protein